jgi:hypothetical protein
MVAGTCAGLELGTNEESGWFAPGGAALELHCRFDGAAA